jgi:hypothetical protein
MFKALFRLSLFVFVIGSGSLQPLCTQAQDKDGAKKLAKAQKTAAGLKMPAGQRADKHKDEVQRAKAPGLSKASKKTPYGNGDSTTKSQREAPNSTLESIILDGSKRLTIRARSRIQTLTLVSSQ